MPQEYENLDLSKWGWQYKLPMFDQVVPTEPVVLLFGRGTDPLGYSGIPSFPGTPGGPPSAYEDPNAPLMSPEDARTFLRNLREQQTYKEEHPSELPSKGAVGEWEQLRHASPKPEFVDPGTLYNIPLGKGKGALLPTAPPYAHRYGKSRHDLPPGKAVEWF